MLTAFSIVKVAAEYAVILVVSSHGDGCAVTVNVSPKSSTGERKSPACTVFLRPPTVTDVSAPREAKVTCARVVCAFASVSV